MGGGAACCLMTLRAWMPSTWTSPCLFYAAMKLLDLREVGTSQFGSMNESDIFVIISPLYNRIIVWLLRRTSWTCQDHVLLMRGWRSICTAKNTNQCIDNPVFNGAPFLIAHSQFPDSYLQTFVFVSL